MDAIKEQERLEKKRAYDRERDKDPRRAAMNLAYKRTPEYRHRENELRRSKYAQWREYKQLCEAMALQNAVKDVDALVNSKDAKEVEKVIAARKDKDKVARMEYYQIHGDRIRESSRIRYALNINGCKDKQRAKDKTNPKRIAYKKEQLRKYKQTEKYKEYARQYAKRYAQRKAKAKDHDITPQLQ